jgi:D-alanyl-D-alanine endopeptidase (penicillin-binding protein 7)
MKKFILLLLFALPFYCEAKPKQHRSNPPSILLMNVTENKVVVGENLNVTRQLASITKLMTAMVALDYSTDLTRKLKLKKGIKSSLPPKEYTRSELFHAMLIRSDNAAAETLASDYPGGREKFLHAMNEKAKKLSMMNTIFQDASGLSSNNVSTANDVADMVIAASNYPIIRETSIKKHAYIEAYNKKRMRTLVLNNTNREILFRFDNIVVSKTGYTTPAGFCVGLMVETKEKTVINHHVIVVLGAKNPKERVDTVKDIMYNEILKPST